MYDMYYVTTFYQNLLMCAHTIYFPVMYHYPTYPTLSYTKKGKIQDGRIKCIDIKDGDGVEYNKY